LNKLAGLGPERVSRADVLNEIVKGRHLISFSKKAPPAAPHPRERPACEFARNAGLSFVAWMFHPCFIEPDKNSIFVSSSQHGLVAYGSPEARGDPAVRSWRGDACGVWPQLQRERVDDFKADGVSEKGICDEQIAL
jgi:hypothetical protein